jgi:hypothetical protein
MQQKNHNKIFFKVNLSDDLDIHAHKKVTMTTPSSQNNSSYNNSFFKKKLDENGSRKIEQINPSYRMEEIKELQSDNESHVGPMRISKSSKMVNKNGNNAFGGQKIV